MPTKALGTLIGNASGARSLRWRVVRQELLDLLLQDSSDVGAGDFGSRATRSVASEARINFSRSGFVSTYYLPCPSKQGM